MNFWEARQAALAGKKVKLTVPGHEFTPDEFMSDDYSFGNYEIKAEWEIVEGPQKVEVWAVVNPDTGKVWDTSPTPISEDDYYRTSGLYKIVKLREITNDNQD